MSFPDGDIPLPLLEVRISGFRETVLLLGLPPLGEDPGEGQSSLLDKRMKATIHRGGVPSEARERLGEALVYAPSVSAFLRHQKQDERAQMPVPAALENPHAAPLPPLKSLSAYQCAKCIIVRYAHHVNSLDE